MKSSRFNGRFQVALAIDDPDLRFDMVKNTVDNPKTLKRIVVGFAVFAATLTVMTESIILAPILAGTPTYESLEVVTGKILQVGVCVGKRGPSSMPVWLVSNGKRLTTWLPCTAEILNLHNAIGITLEVRSRTIPSDFLSDSQQDVWSVKAGDVDLYSYQARVERNRSHFGTYMLAMSLPIVMILMVGFFAFGMLRKNTVKLQDESTGHFLGTSNPPRDC